MRRLISRLREEQKGASAVALAMMMTVVLIIAALVIDVGAMSARNAQLQDAADAAALAIAQQCYESPATNELNGCDPAVRAAATNTAIEFAEATLNDGNASVIGSPLFDLHRVTIQLASVQPVLFAWAAGSNDTTVGASATAQWNQGAVALPLAVNACALGTPDTATQFVGTGLYNGVAGLLGAVTGITTILSGGTLPDYLDNILNCQGTDVLAGGWLASPNGDCTYDPNLITELSSVLNKVLPINSCTTVVQGLIGKRVILPVYDESSTIQSLGNLLGSATVTRYAEIIVTGYDFDGIFGVGGNELTNYPSGRSPGCTGTLDELLGINLGILSGAVDFLLATLGINLADILACQGIQGQIVSTTLTAQEASEILIPYRLVA